MYRGLGVAGVLVVWLALPQPAVGQYNGGCQAGWSCVPGYSQAGRSAPSPSARNQGKQAGNERSHVDILKVLWAGEWEIRNRGLEIARLTAASRSGDQERTALRQETARIRQEAATARDEAQADRASLLARIEILEAKLANVEAARERDRQTIRELEEKNATQRIALEYYARSHRPPPTIINRPRS